MKFELFGAVTRASRLRITQPLSLSATYIVYMNSRGKGYTHTHHRFPSLPAAAALREAITRHKFSLASERASGKLRNLHSTYRNTLTPCICIV